MESTETNGHATPTARPTIEQIITNIETPAPAETPAAPVVEPPKEEPKPEAKKEDDKLAPKFAALAKQEKELLAKRKEVEAQLKEAREFQNLKKLLTENPPEFFEKMGTSYDDIVAKIIEAPTKPQTSEDKLRTELEQVKKQIADKEAQVQAAEQQRAIEGFKNEQKEFILKEGKKFELVNALGAYEAVFDTANEWYKQHNEIPKHEEMGLLVETYLKKEYGPLLEKLKQTETFKDFFATPDKTNTSQPQSQSLIDSIPKTITQTMKQTSTSSDARPKTREELLKEAMKLIGA